MKNFFDKFLTEKTFAAGTSTFCVGFGLITCRVPDFMCGFFAGMAALITYVMWTEHENDD